MQKTFYRTQLGVKALMLCVMILGVVAVSMVTPVRAMDLLADPNGTLNPATFEPVVFVVPMSTNSLPPTPVRKPEPRVAILKTSAATPAGSVIARAVTKGNTLAAHRMLNNPGVARNMTVIEFDRLRAKVAAGYLSDNDLANALALAKASQRRSGADVPMAGWIAGLSAWRLGDYPSALNGFASTAQSKQADDWMRAAGAFWAARAAIAMGNRSLGDVYLTLAGQYDRTFYGLLARTQMGRPLDFNWQTPAFGGAHLDLLARNELGRVAMDHVVHGRLSAADRTLMQIARDGDAQVKMAALGYAAREGLPATALKLARTIEFETGLRFDAAYYPMGSWVEAQDYKMDRALVHAIIRQESSFNPNARSGQGAVGLMQLLPSTAHYVTRVMEVNARPSDLTHSQNNINMGQHYLQYLLADQNVNGDLLNLLIAYNAGPGNLAKWQKRLPEMDNDPLLFIESIPSPETRGYVEKVMAAYWIYRDRLGLPNTTLTALAANRPVAYAQPAPWAMGLKLSAIWP